MAVQYFKGVVHHQRRNHGSIIDDMETGVQDAVDEMNNSSSHTYASFFPNFTPDVGGPLQEAGTYLKNFASEIESSNQPIGDGDVWIIVDDRLDLGYGDTLTQQSIYDNGWKTIHVGRALDLFAVSAIAEGHKDIQEVVKHNIGHSMGLSRATGHSYGTYSVNPSTGKIEDITPMARSYVRGGSDGTVVDTCWSPNGNVPDSFSGGKDNYVERTFCGGAISACAHDCRHTLSYSARSRNEIHSNTPR